MDFNFRFRLALILSVLCICPGLTYSQTIGPGIYDLPDDGNFGDSETVGSNTTININSGGEIGNEFRVGVITGTSTNNFVNLLGGSIGDGMNAYGGSTITIDSGSIGENFRAGRVVSVSMGLMSVDFNGGVIGRDFTGSSNSVVNMSGGVLEENATIYGDLNLSGGEIKGIQNTILNRQYQLTVYGTMTMSGGTTEDIEIRSGSLTMDGGTVRRLELRGLPDSYAEINGGTILGTTTARSNSQLFVNGGRLGGLAALYESSVEVSGGHVGSLRADSDSDVIVSGGVFGQFQALLGSKLTLQGNDFVLNGISTSASNLTLNAGDVFSGTLEDGSAFVFSRDMSDQLNNVTINRVSVADADTGTIFVNDSNGPNGLRRGQHLVLQTGGTLDDSFSAVGAELEIEDGEVGNRLVVSESQVSLSGGTVEDSFNALQNSSVSISGGEVGRDFAVRNSSIEVSGGSIGSGMRVTDGSLADISGGNILGLTAFSGSEVNITGGVIGQNGSRTQSSAGFDILSGAEVVVSGGAFADLFTASANTLSLEGNDFKLNGEEFTGTSISLGSTDVFSGTFLDGNSFVFANSDIDRLTQVTLIESQISTVDTTPITVDGSFNAPFSIRDNQTMTLVDGGSISSSFTAADSTLIVEGGFASAEIELINSSFSMSGGELNDLDAFTGATVDIVGGTLRSVEAFHDSTVSVSGADIDRWIIAREGSVVDMSTAISGTVVALDGSQINFNIFDAFLNGNEIDGLSNGVPLLIEDRNVTFSGTMIDGTSFSFFISSSFGSGAGELNTFATGAQFTVTQFTAVPEPSSSLIICTLAIAAALRRRRED